MLIQLARPTITQRFTFSTLTARLPESYKTYNRLLHSLRLGIEQIPKHRSCISSVAHTHRTSKSFADNVLTRSAESLLPLIHRRGTKLQALLGEAGLTEMDSYAFPDYRLKKKLDDPSKTPLLLVACGSFSPITFLHLRMFVMAGDYIKLNTDFELIGGYLSPVSDAYKKQGLAIAEHR